VTRRPRIRRRRRTTRSRLALNLRALIVLLLAGMLPALASLSTSATQAAHAATACTGPGNPATCAVTVNAFNLQNHTALANFNYIINKDNTKLPTDPLALSTESNSPVVAEGNQLRRTVNLPAGRYLISVRSTPPAPTGR
jgi:large repetitive protein